MVGLCHGFGEVYKIDEILGLDEKHLTYEIPGVNHFVWLTHCYYKGRDVFPMIDEWLETKAEEYWETTTAEGVMGKKKMDLYRKYRAVPIGDTASITGASWPWWYHSDKEVEKVWGTDSRQWRQDCILRLKNSPLTFKKYTQDKNEKLFNKDSLKMSGEPVIPIIESVTCDKPRVIITNIG